MSIEIYDGIRFPLTRLGEFTQWTRSVGLRAVEKRAKEILSRVENDVINLTDEQKKFDDERKATFIRETQVFKVIKIIRDAALSPNRDRDDLHQGWLLFVKPGAKYVLGYPWGSFPDLYGVKKPKWVEDYGYWNNVDPDENCTDRQWRQRKKDWAIIDKDPGNSLKLMLNVFEAKERPSLDVIWLELRLLRHKLSNGKPYGEPLGKPRKKKVKS